MKLRLKTGFHSRPPKIFQRTKDGYYYTRQKIDHQDHWTCLWTKSQKAAENLAYKNWFYQQNKEVQEIFEIPLEYLDTVWLKYENTDDWQNLKSSTQATKRTVWNSFYQWAQSKNLKFVQQITPEQAETFLEMCGKTNKTFNNNRNDLSKAFSEICRSIRKENPFSLVRPRSISRGERASSEFRAFTDNEIIDILEYIAASRMKFRDEWLMACEIARFTGLRYKDVALLTWSCIRLETDRPYIDTVPQKTETITGKAVLIRLVPYLRDLLKSKKKTSFYVLPNLAANYDERHGTQAFSDMLTLKGIKGSAGYKVGFHSFRSTVVTKAKLAHIDFKLFGGVMGHSDENQTEHYNKAAIDIDMSFLSYNGVG